MKKSILELSQNEASWKERKALRVLNSVCYDVEKVPNGDKYSIIDREKGKKLANVSSDYTLITNEELFLPFIRHFGIDKVNAISTCGNGKYNHLEIRTGRQFNMGTDSNPDMIGESLIIQNSYNKTRSLRIALGAFRFVCSNGLYYGDNILEIRTVHMGNINLQDIRYQVLTSYYQNNFDNWNKLRDSKVSINDQHKIIDGFETFEAKRKDTSDLDSSCNNQINSDIRGMVHHRLNNNPEKTDQETFWSLYNQVNYSIARICRGRSRVNKRILGNKNAESYLLEKINNN